MQQEELEQAIDVALEGAPRAEQLTVLADTLRERRAGFARELEATQDEAKKRELRKRLAEMDKQIAGLEEQRAVSQFVEFSVRASALRPEQEPAAEDDEE